MDGLLFEFDNYPTEHKLIGDMLLAYGEIEFCLLSCISQALNDDTNTSTRILFRVRGESSRMEVADAILRPAYRKVGLEGKWSNAFGAAKHSKNIRNQYAHCHWQTMEDREGLFFINLDTEAASSIDNLQVTVVPLHLDLVRQQHQYFQYALACLYYLLSAYPPKVGREDKLKFPEPKSIPAPPLYRKKARPLVGREAAAIGFKNC